MGLLICEARVNDVIGRAADGFSEQLRGFDMGKDHSFVLFAI